MTIPVLALSPTREQTRVCGIRFPNTQQGQSSARMTDEKALGPVGAIQRALSQWLDLSAAVPAEHIQLLGQLDQTACGEIGAHKFKIGQAVQFSPQSALVTPGLYIVTGLLPERDGELEYCIYNEAEPYQRVAKESELR